MTVLKIKLISGLHLPKSSLVKSQPYVKLRLRGHPEDEAEWESQVVPRNGFNPIWNETAEFNLKLAELAVLEVEVRSRGGKEDVQLAVFCVAVPLVRRGYRTITLENLQGRRLTPANLFVHVEKNEKPMQLLKTKEEEEISKSNGNL